MNLVLEEKLTLDCILRHCLIPADRRVLLAVSGGADSVAMARILARLISQGVINAHIMIAHINHGLRACAIRDQQFVEQLARQIGVPFACESIDVASAGLNQKLSTETAGRKLRREALIRIAIREQCTHVATAHHADDNAETLIFRLKRGTAYRGLCGIFPKKDFDGIKFIRPLLLLRSKDIQSYLKEIGQNFCQDPTNQDVSFSRNFIRHLLLPHLQKNCKRDLCVSLNRLATSAGKMQERIDRETQSSLETIVMERSKTCVEFEKKAFNQLAKPIRTELLRKSLVHLKAGQRNLTRKHYERMLQFASGPGNRTLELPGGYCLKTNRMRFILQENRSKMKTPS